MEVTFLDVGHGCCTVIVSPKQRAVTIVDCKGGPGAKAISYLRAHDLGDPSLVFISHLHDDHVAGFADVFRYLRRQRVEVKRVYSNYAGHTSRKRSASGGQAVMDQLRELLGDDNARLQEFTNSAVPYTDDGLTFTILHPDRFDLLSHQDRDDMLNDLSGVLRVGFGQSSVLLPGDIEGWGASKMIRTVGNEAVSSSLLLFPHHGAGWEHETAEGTPRTRHQEVLRPPKVFVDAIGPTWTVVSVGSDNDGNWDSWEHPSPLVLSVLRRWHSQTSGGFICTEVTRHCAPAMARNQTNVPCGGHVRFRLYRDGGIELVEPNAVEWRRRKALWKCPQCET